MTAYGKSVVNFVLEDGPLKAIADHGSIMAYAQVVWGCNAKLAGLVEAYVLERIA